MRHLKENAALQQLLAAPGPVDRNALLSLAQQLVRVASRQPGLVFAIPGYEDFAQEVVSCSQGWLELGEQERKTHDDGRDWLRFASPVEDRHVVVVGGPITDTDLMRMYKLGYNAWHYNARKLTFLFTYHADQRQERAQLDGEAIDGLYSSAMFSAIPKTPEGNNVFLVDIHADAVIGFFAAGGMRCSNIQVLNHLITSEAAANFGNKCLICAPDAGRGKIVAKTAETLGLPYAIANKLRSAKGAKTNGLMGNVRKRNVLLSDDMGVSFSSAIGAAEHLKKKGAEDIRLVVTHAVVPKEESMDKLIASGLFSGITFTDSLLNARRLAAKYPDFTRLVPLAPLVTPYLIG